MTLLFNYFLEVKIISVFASAVSVLVLNFKHLLKLVNKTYNQMKFEINLLFY